MLKYIKKEVVQMSTQIIEVILDSELDTNCVIITRKDSGEYDELYRGPWWCIPFGLVIIKPYVIVQSGNTVLIEL